MSERNPSVSPSRHLRRPSVSGTTGGYRRRSSIPNILSVPEDPYPLAPSRGGSALASLLQAHRNRSSASLQLPGQQSSGGGGSRYGSISGPPASVGGGGGLEAGLGGAGPERFRGSFSFAAGAGGSSPPRAEVGGRGRRASSSPEHLSKQQSQPPDAADCGPGPMGSSVVPGGGGILAAPRDHDAVLRRAAASDDVRSDVPPEPRHVEDRRVAALLRGKNMRSMRLIGHANPRYRWERYWKTDEELAKIRKRAVREYYERTNMLIRQYLYIDRLLDSSLPHDLLNEYEYNDHLQRMQTSPAQAPAPPGTVLEIPATIAEEPHTGTASPAQGFENRAGVSASEPALPGSSQGSTTMLRRVKRTPKDIYRPAETRPLLSSSDDTDEEPEDAGGVVRRTENGTSGSKQNGDHADGRVAADVVHDPEDGRKLDDIPLLSDEDDDLDAGAPIVTVAIYVNLAANVVLLVAKLIVVLSVPSMSVLASLVDAVLDFLSTAIVWTTTWLIAHHDQYRYPVGRRRLEPIGVLVFSVVMITSFTQVALECIQRLFSGDHSVIELGIPALCIMLGTVVVKAMVWLWCRLIKNSSVQALASDALTDVVFNTGSIFFPIVGYFLRIWWLDAFGGLVLSLVVIVTWSRTSAQHIKNLTGFSATADQRNVLLYLTMRFAKTIKQIQGLQAYHAGDKLNVEVDIVLDADTPLKDSHDLSESLSYVLESVPIVDRAFVHVDYASYNLPTHMQQQQPG